MKNGKLFGKINLIDFLVLLVILVGIAAVAVFFFMPKNTGDTLVMKFRIEEVDEFVAAKVHIGDDLYDDTYQLDFGKVIDVELDDSISYGEVVDGVYTLTSKEGYYSMIITGELQGKKTSLGAEIGGKKYGVGHSFVLRAGDAKLFLRVYDIMLKEDYEAEKNAVKDDVSANYVNMSLYAPEVESFIADNIETGNAVTDAVRKYELGTVEALTVGDAVVYFENDAGIISGAKDGYSSVTIDVRVLGDKTSAGITVGRRTYSVGDEVELVVGSSRLTAKVSSVG